MANSKGLISSRSFRAASEDAVDAVDNGCGPSGVLGKFVPNVLFGVVRMQRACRIHDWDYTIEDVPRWWADLKLLLNGLLLCLYAIIGGAFSVLAVLIYYISVVIGGRSHWGN